MKTTIILNQETAYSIVVPNDATPVEITASEELRCYLEKVYGVCLPICTENAANGMGFYIGRTAYAEAAGVCGTSVENWIIKMHDGNVILTGGVNPDDRGIIYAVYHFLEDVVGVRWWSDWEEYIPETDELSLEEDCVKEGTPAFSYRKILANMHLKDFYYSARTRGNVVGDDGLAEGAYGNYPGGVRRFGGAIHMARPHHTHTLNKILPSAEYYEDHPEWFAWSDAEGKRIPHGHYCLSSEGLYEALLEKIMVCIEEDKALEKETGVPIPIFYDVSCPDFLGGFCQCEACKASIEKSGPSGYILQFVNKIARGVGEHHPDVLISGSSYAAHIEPPKDGTLPDKNVILKMAHVFEDIIHDTENRGNENYKRLLYQWGEVCKKADCAYYIWEYMYNLFIDMPLPISKRLCQLLRTFYECGISGIFVENEKLSTDMWELLQYMLVHLCEDPYLDEETLLNDFLPKFYGAAGDYVRDYIELINACALEHDFSVFCIIESMHFNYLDARTVVKGMEILNQALDAVKGDSVLESRVRYIRTLLVGSMLVKFFDLKKIAVRQGVAFEFDPEELRKMVIEGLEDAKKHPKFEADSKALDDEIAYYGNMTLIEESAPLPAELSDVNAEDAYQFFYKNSSRHISDMPDYGISYVDDSDSALGRVQKIQRTPESDPLQMMVLFTTSKEDEYSGGITIRIQQNGEYIDGVELFKEDIVPDAYHLYKIGSADNIGKYGDTRVDIFGSNFEWLSLSGISVAFPMDACDVYLSMKFTGEMYGGKKGSEEAIYLDRAIVVRK